MELTSTSYPLDTLLLSILIWEDFCFLFTVEVQLLSRTSSTISSVLIKRYPLVLRQPTQGFIRIS